MCRIQSLPSVGCRSRSSGSGNRLLLSNCRFLSCGDRPSHEDKEFCTRREREGDGGEGEGGKVREKVRGEGGEGEEGRSLDESQRPHRSIHS